MKSPPGTWHRVSRQRPCPICGKPDWCLLAGDPRDPGAAICARTESPKRCGEAGWLHRLRDDPTGQPRRPRVQRLAVARPDRMRPHLARQAELFRRAVRPDALGRLAGNLGLSVGSLERLGIGWSEGHRAWTLPMLDADGQVLGIRLRLSNGRKLSVRGGREGLFIPADLPDRKPLVICEGPTDTAAMLDLGFAAIGRPSCAGGLRLLVDFLRRRDAPEVVVVADADGPGRRGAQGLAAVLLAYAAAVRVIVPPAGIKDARQWKRGGATRQEIQAVIDAAPARKLAIHVRRRAGSRNHGRR